MRHFALILLLLCALPHAALAYSDQERIDQLERDMLVLQRKLERSTPDSSSPVDDVTGIADSNADVRITALEEEIRNLRGRLEEKEFENRTLSEQLDVFKKDVEYRLQSLEGGANPSPAAPSAPAEEGRPVSQSDEPTPLLQSNKGNMEISIRDQGDAPTTPAQGAFETARDHYNYAFRMLNQNQYDESASSFTDFIAKHPKDPLIGNAYYWLGETYYIRSNYGKATDYFRQGFEAMPKGPKAVDNLLKLGMSLARENKNKESCIVLSQVMTRYKDVSANSANKAAAEHKRIGCE